ncbi:uncharacterized protein LOC127001499 isoform X2 [Eriocheir sinensis]|nr:uncharacterized protein LOC127001499 isoform X2 [Eriocheir sinensis]
MAAAAVAVATAQHFDAPLPPVIPFKSLPRDLLTQDPYAHLPFFVQDSHDVLHNQILPPAPFGSPPSPSFHPKFSQPLPFPPSHSNPQPFHSPHAPKFQPFPPLHPSSSQPFSHSSKPQPFLPSHASNPQPFSSSHDSSSFRSHSSSPLTGLHQAPPPPHPHQTPPSTLFRPLGPPPTTVVDPPAVHTFGGSLEKFGSLDNFGPPDKFGPLDNFGPPDKFGPLDNFGPPDKFGPLDKFGSLDKVDEVLPQEHAGPAFPPSSDPPRFPSHGYDIESYFSDFPSFGFFDFDPDKGGPSDSRPLPPFPTFPEDLPIDEVTRDTFPGQHAPAHPPKDLFKSLNAFTQRRGRSFAPGIFRSRVPRRAAPFPPPPAMPTFPKPRPESHVP